MAGARMRFEVRARALPFSPEGIYSSYQNCFRARPLLPWSNLLNDLSGFATASEDIDNPSRVLITVCVCVPNAQTSGNERQL
jgi:hypothetical protein